MPEDADAIADVHARSWQVTNRGLLPDEVIDGVVGGRSAWANGMRAMLAVADEPHRLFVALEGDAVVGMAVTAPARDPDA